MKRNCLLLLILCFFTFKSYSQTYIQNVTIIDVVNQKLIPKQTVMIDNGIIANVQLSTKINIPANANVIQGEGKFLMPGMTDAHVHFFQSGGLYTRPDVIDLSKFQPYEKEIKWVHSNMNDFLRRYVQNGITSVIDVGSTIDFLKQRDTFQNKAYAPHVFMTGPLLTSYEPEVYKNLKEDEPFILVTTPEEGIKAVNAQLTYHPDFIKIWYIVDERNKDSIETSAKIFQPVVKAIVYEAHKNNLKVAVHATQQISAQLAVESGCDYLVHGIDDEIVSDDFINLLKEKNVIICPTLTVVDGYNKTFSLEEDYSFYDLTKSNPKQIGSIEDLKHLFDTATINHYMKITHSPEFISRWKKSDSIRMVNLKKMADGGVTNVAGTDAGNIGTQHATSFYEELLAMKQSGLTNWQIIQSATINPAKILNRQDSLGSIAIGKKADMVLLNANPVDDIQNLIKIDIVINKGVVIDPDTLIAATPETLVQQQVNAFNARNIDAFLEPYADSIELYNFPNELIAKGKEKMREQYGWIFNQSPNLHCEIKGRIIKGNFVVDRESVSGTGRPDNMEAIAIYEIKHEKIIKAWFVR